MTDGSIKKWLLSYVWRSASDRRDTFKRSVVVKATHKPTRSVAEQLARLDLLKNVIGHSHGQYGYRAITHIKTAETA